MRASAACSARLYANAVCLAVICAWVKVLMFLRIDPRIGPLVLVLLRCFRDFARFAVLLLAIVPAFYVVFLALVVGHGVVVDAVEPAVGAGAAIGIGANLTAAAAATGAAPGGAGAVACAAASSSSSSEVGADIPVDLSYFLLWSLGRTYYSTILDSTNVWVRITLAAYIIVVPGICASIYMYSTYDKCIASNSK